MERLGLQNGENTLKITKKYNVVLADPPWRYRQGKSMGTNFQGAADAQYLCMDYKEIANLPIKKISDNKCILFLWVTMPMLKEGIYVLENWGFEYKTVAFTWLKTNINNMGFFFGIGYYTKSNVEICLLGTKGNAHTLVKNNSISQVIITPKQKHSRKPQEARDKIVKLVGDLPRIEIFARSTKKIENGWVNVGNGVDGCDIRDSLKKIVNGTYLESDIDLTTQGQGEFGI